MELNIGRNMGVLLVFCLAIHYLGTVGANKVTEIEFLRMRAEPDHIIQNIFLSCLCGADIPHSMSCNSRFNSTHPHQRYIHCVTYVTVWALGPPYVTCTVRAPMQCKKREHHHCKSDYRPLNLTGYCFDDCMEMYFRLSENRALRPIMWKHPQEKKCLIKHTSDYHPRKHGLKNPSASGGSRKVRGNESHSALAWALLGIIFLALVIVSGLLVFVWWRGRSQRARRASDMAMLFNRNDDRLAVGNTTNAQG